jgi:hypothetical protein
VSYFLVFVVAWFYTTLFHELAHAFFARLRGAQVTRVIPYWHWYFRNPASGRLIMSWVGLPPPLGKPPIPVAQFRFAGYEWEGGDPPKAVESLAPVLMDALTTVLAFVSMFFIPWGYGALFMLCAVIDAVVWMLGYLDNTPGSDGHRFSTRSW